MKSVIKITEDIIYAVALMILLCAAVCYFTHVQPVVVLSGSMEPAIKTGSLAFINEKDKEIKKGDIIAYKLGDMVVSHRVVDITDEGYKTKGDNNDTADNGVVRHSDVKGTIIFSIPVVGFVLKAIVMPIGVAASLLYIIMKVILRGKKYVKEK